MEKFRVNILPNLDGVVPSDGELLEAAKEAGWTDDPGQGKAILISDERGNGGYEVVSPIPIAPPIGWTPTPPIEELIRQTVAREMSRFDEQEVDDIVEAEDFDIPDEVPALETIYEFIAMEPQAPSVKEPTPEERAAAQVAYEDVLDRHRRVAKGRAREEYERRIKEARELHGEPPDDPNFIRDGKGA